MIAQFILTNLNQPLAAAHKRFISNSNDSITCETISSLESEEKCNFASTNKFCHELDFLIDYPKYLYCTCDSNYTESCILLLVMLSILYIIIIVVTAYTSLAPNIIAITKHLNLSEYGGAICAIALSSTISTILELIERHENDTEYIIIEVYSVDIHLRCLVAGIILIMSPIVLNPLYYIRDQIFYLCGLIISFSILEYEKPQYKLAILGILLFILILIIVFIQEKQSFLQQDKEYMETPAEQIILKINDTHTLYKQFWYSIEPRRLKLAYRSYKWQKIILIIGLPVNTLIALCVPVYHPLLPQNGWSKLLNIINLYILPIIYSFVIYPNSPKFLVFIYFTVITAFAIDLIYKSSPNEPPDNHIAFAYIGNFYCIGFIFIIESELLSVLEILGYTIKLSRPAIALHLLSYGRIIAPCILAFTIASWGFNRMAYKIIIFSPIALTNLSIAVLVLFRSFEHNYSTEIRPGVNGLAAIMFTFVEFFICFVASIFLNFHLRKSVGYVQVICYCMFILMKILAGTNFIHPYGTDHSLEFVGTDAPWG